MSWIPRSRRGALTRFGIAAVLIVAFTATSTAVALLLQFKQFAKDLSFTPALKHAAIEIANPGKPQTLLLIGSDHRAGTPFKTANTDTMMLVRLDPKSTTINVLSVPRDLRVQIPEGNVSATNRINVAYADGGPNLLVRILRQQVFPGLKVNHIIDVNFGGFRDLIDAIGCVYVDADRRYYNLNIGTPDTNYSSIDIQPGYQKMCGTDALAFVRFRHLDNDLVRNARQQDFLRWAKSQFSGDTLVSNRDKLIKIFGKHTQTDADLHSISGLINLFELVAFSAGHTIKQIPFPATFLPCGGQGIGGVPCYDVANPRAEHAAFMAFMKPTPASTGGGASSGAGPGPRSRPGPSPLKAPGLTSDLPDGRAQASLLAGAGLPVYFPRLIRSGSRYCTNGTCVEGPVLNSYPRSYLIHDRDGKPHASYRITLVIDPALGQYYGVQGTTWQNPPILNKPTQVRFIAGKQLLLYQSGSHLTMVAWRTPAAVYWISNTLTSDLSNQQMLGIAASLTRDGH